MEDFWVDPEQFCTNSVSEATPSPATFLDSTGPCHRTASKVVAAAVVWVGPGRPSRQAHLMMVPVSSEHISSVQVMFKQLRCCSATLHTSRSRPSAFAVSWHSMPPSWHVGKCIGNAQVSTHYWLHVCRAHLLMVRLTPAVL